MAVQGHSFGAGIQSLSVTLKLF